jgi:hypothetical protein
MGVSKVDTNRNQDWFLVNVSYLNNIILFNTILCQTFVNFSHILSKKFLQNRADNRKDLVRCNLREHIAENRLEHSESRSNFDRNLCSKLEQDAILVSSKIEKHIISYVNKTKSEQSATLKDYKINTFWISTPNRKLMLRIASF